MNTPMDTPTNPTDQDLTAHLTRQADAFFTRGGAELDLGQVLDRAGEIRRGRRMRATMLMAACLLAIAVPTALVATRADERPLTPATPTKVDRSPLSLDGLERGKAPEQYAAGTTWIDEVGRHDRPALSGLVEVAPLDGALVAVTRAESGNLRATVFDASGDEGAQWSPVEGGLAVSDDGRTVAFVTADGTPVVVRNASDVTELARVPRGTGFDAVAVTGNCETADDKDPCAVWVQSNGAKPGSWYVTSNAASTARTEYRSIDDVRAEDRAAGTTEVHDDLTTCSAVEAPGLDAPGWRMCGFHVAAFAPDGRHLLAEPDGDGLGPTGLALYDADNGEQLVDLAVADQGYIRQMVWEDDSHVLATIYQGQRWGVLRIGLDGSREYAVTPVRASDDVDPPFVLPTR